MMQSEATVILDNGSGSSKIGFAGDNTPTTVFPSVIGKLKNNSLLDNGTKDSYIGDEALLKRGMLTLKYPIEHGIITNWDDMEKIWYHSFCNELRVLPEDHPVLLTESPSNTKLNREKEIQIMFETFNIPALNISNTAYLSLYSSGRNTGIVLDSGKTVTHAVSINNGNIISNGVISKNFGGLDLTNYMTKLISESGYQFTSYYEKNFYEDIKETLTYVALDYEKQLEHFDEKSYELPDGIVITLRKELFKCPEVLFNPSLLNLNYRGVHQMIYDSCTNTTDEIKRQLLNNIVLTGGSTLFPGISDRLKKELNILLSFNIKINTPSNRQYSSWNGASMFATNPSFQDTWISSEKYEEYGPSVFEVQL